MSFKSLPMSIVSSDWVRSLEIDFLAFFGWGWNRFWVIEGASVMELFVCRWNS